MKKIKNKISQWKHTLAESKLAARMRTSGAARILGNGWRRYQSNPFPIQIVWILLFRVVLDFVYITLLSPQYSYSGYTTQVMPLVYMVSWMMLIVAAPLVVSIQRKDYTPSNVLVTCLNYLYFIPMTSLCGCKGYDMRFIVVVLLYWMAFLIFQVKIPVLRLQKTEHQFSHKIFRWMTVLAILFVMGVSGYYTGFRFKLNIQDVYSVRTEAASYDIPGIVAYALSWMTVILSVLILYWIQRKRWLPTVLLIVTYFFYYSISASKSVFFFLFLLIGVYMVYRSWMMQWVAPALSVGALACWLFAQVTDNIILLSLFVRRFMYVPTSLSNTIWQFIQENHPHDIFRGTLLGKLGFDSIYSIGYARVIGEYAGSPQTNCNNGMIGDMIFNLPVSLGVFLMPLLLILCFRLLDLSTSKLRPPIFVGICVYLANSFCNSTWSTVLLTHGFLISCVLLYLFPSTEEKSINEIQ